MGLLGNKLGPLFVWQALVLVAVLGASSVAAFAGFGLAGGTANAGVGDDEQLVPATIGDLISVVTTDGSLSFPIVETATFGVAGTVGEILVGEGDQVEEGQALARLDAGSIATLTKIQAKAAVDLRDAQDSLDVATGDPDALGLATAEVAVVKAETALAEAIDQHQAVVYAAADHVLAVASASLDYQAAFGSWLGVPESEVDSALSPSVLLTRWGADLSEIYGAALTGETSTKMTEFKTQPVIDDPGTIWNEASVSVFITFYPGTLVGECTGGTAPSYGVCVREVLDLAWSAVQAARSDQVSNIRGATIAKADILAAEADLDAATEDLEDVRSGADQEDIELLTADHVIAEQAFATAQGNLAAATLVAPFAGSVDSIDLEVGGNAGGQAASITVVDESVIEIAGTVDEVDVLSISEGAVAAVSLSALPGQSLRGVVTEIGSPSNNQGVVTFPVSVQVDAPADLTLREGLTATASVVVSQELNVLRVPTAAITGSFLQPTVRVYDGGKVGEREVELGSSDGFWVVVVAGLREGEQVVMPAPSASTTQFGNFSFGALPTGTDQRQILRQLQGGGGFGGGGNGGAGRGGR
ncbi:MAG: HlyD family efflux transporter periplasmic adaptor subunit [Chloroflexi bacterium]|nr:HlyD family efflux transporter periplasmic adaptor subunit [Chloroflexota bacterium]